jgi:hypothetical protein
MTSEEFEAVRAGVALSDESKMWNEPAPDTLIFDWADYKKPKKGGKK